MPSLYIITKGLTKGGLFGTFRGMKKAFLLLIRAYQKTLSLDHGILAKLGFPRVCRFYPSCSQYTYEAVLKYGIIKGIWMGTKRLSRCHPWSEGGYDPVK